MQLGNTYQNPFNEDYTIRTFKYYISRVTLSGDNGKAVLFPGAHLVNEADSSTRTIIIHATETHIKSISFLVGVDSVYNVTGTQAGDLDPMKGMFWTWNSGYIIAKMEAASSLSPEPNNNVTFHIGGFKTGVNATRLITLNLPENSLAYEDKATTEIVIEANANKWFNAVHDLKIADHPVCALPGKLAVQFADNYAQMFTIASVK